MHRLKLQTGSNIVEFAFVMPLLLILVFGIIDFSIGLYDKAVITNAVREGARSGIVFAPTRLTEPQVEHGGHKLLQQQVDYVWTSDGQPRTPLSAQAIRLKAATPLTVSVDYHVRLRHDRQAVPRAGQPSSSVRRV